ncbi:purine permease 1-like, partial [Asparagus officinalis]|uniref:purine permease 1-like n=1 Tax=Asparagus officinalis TaxID=4686 RepID=UPI00098DE3EC
TAGFPLILLPLSLSYLLRRRNSNPDLPAKSRTRVTALPLFVSTAFLGALVGLDDFLYAYGMSYLPVSTSSLLISTQLGFTALFAFLVVRQKFTAFSINAVALLSFGALVLGIQAKGDRPRGVSRGQYYLGFVMMLGTAALYGLVLPLVELVYRKVKGTVTFTLVMEMQFVMGLFATLFCVVGMIVNKDFQVVASPVLNSTISCCLD